MNTNPGNGVNRNFPKYISNLVSSITSAITDGKALNYSIHTGAFGVPYAMMGLVTIIASTFTYVTYTDYINDPEDEEEDDEEDDEEESENGILGMFNTLNNNSADSNPEDAEQKEPEDAEQKEPEDAEQKEPEDAEKKEPEDAEKKDPEDAEKKEIEDEKNPEEPGKQYTLGGKPRSRKKTPTKRKYTKRKSQR